MESLERPGVWLRSSFTSSILIRLRLAPASSSSLFIATAEPDDDADALACDCGVPTVMNPLAVAAFMASSITRVASWRGSRSFVSLSRSWCSFTVSVSGSRQSKFAKTDFLMHFIFSSSPGSTRQFLLMRIFISGMTDKVGMVEKAPNEYYRLVSSSRSDSWINNRQKWSAAEI